MDDRFSKTDVHRYAPSGDSEELEVDGCISTVADSNIKDLLTRHYETIQCYDSGNGYSLKSQDSVDGGLLPHRVVPDNHNDGAPVAVARTDDYSSHFLSQGRFQSKTSDYYSNDDVQYHSEDLQEPFSKMELHDEGFHSHGESGDLPLSKTKSQLDNQTCFLEERQSSQVQHAMEIFYQDDDGDTQLHMSIIQGLIDLALYFISIPLDSSWLDIPNNLLQTPLHLAVITNQASVVSRLMTGGADVDPKDNRGNTPLHIACIEGYNPIITCLLDPIKYVETQQNLYEISYQKIPQDLEARNYDGRTCLHLAAERTFLSVIRVLLAKGANINAQDGKSGRTVLHYAAESGNHILLIQLLKYPTLNLDAETYGGATALVLAHGRGFTDIVNILKGHGAVYNIGEEESSEEEMNETMYDDFRINGEPVSFT